MNIFIKVQQYIQYIKPHLDYLIWWLALILFDTAGQIEMKMASQAITGTAFGRFWFQELLTSWPIWAALTCYSISFLVWLNILKQTELSIAFPLSSLNYITIMLASWLIFEESIGLLQLLGVMLIMMGVIILSWGENE